MKIRHVDFCRVWCGSGVLGFVGEGYWWTRFSALGVQNKRVTFVTKTLTLLPHKGNVGLKSNFKPRRLFPETLQIKFRKGVVVNRFGFSNPGIKKVLACGSLQSLDRPFFISIGTVSQSIEARQKDIEGMVEVLGRQAFCNQYGIQLNISCPNLEDGTQTSIDEKINHATLCGTLGVPLLIKVSPDTSVEDFFKLEALECVDGFIISNTQKSAAGGVSGFPLKDGNIRLVRELRNRGLKKHINAGGGILSYRDAADYIGAGADSVFIWSVVLLRPWRVLSILKLDEKTY
jgi:dihydroorotate dehydrogenase